jgi:hypothetical protein
MRHEARARQLAVDLRPEGRGGVRQPAGADFVAVAAVLEGVGQAVKRPEGQPEDAIRPGQVGFL